MVKGKDLRDFDKEHLLNGRFCGGVPGMQFLVPTKSDFVQQEDIKGICAMGKRQASRGGVMLRSTFC